MSLKKLTIVGFALFSLQGFALPLPFDGQSITQLPTTFTRDFDFEGIVSLNNCSGSLVRFTTSNDSDKAMILTNGHCYEGGFLRPGTYKVDVSSSRRFGLYGANGSKVGTLTATRLIYATMTKTDLSLYSVNMTYAEILSRYNVRPLTMANVPAAPGQNMEVVSGYWERGYRCQVEAIIPTLMEDGWEWHDSIRYSRPGCEVIGGTSGSPIIESGTRTVIGVNNTGNESGQRCTRNNPCEVNENGDVFYKKGYSYGEQTYWIYTCLDSNNQFNLAQKGCELPH